MGRSECQREYLFEYSKKNVDQCSQREVIAHAAPVIEVNTNVICGPRLKKAASGSSIPVMLVPRSAPSPMLGYRCATRDAELAKLLK